MRRAGHDTSVPRSVSVFTAVLAVLAAACAALTFDDGTSIHWVGAAGLLLILVVAGRLQLEFQYGRDVEALDVFDAVLALAIYALSGPVTVLAVAIAKLTSERWQRVEPVKARFNTAQWAAAAGVGSLVFSRAGGRSEPSLRNLALLGVAMVAASTVNHFAVVGVLRLTGRGTIRRILVDLSSVALRGWVAGGLLNLAFGYIFVTSWSSAPWVTPLFLVPLGLLHWANRNYAEARADRARLAGLQQATRVLQGPVDPRTALPAFLAELRSAFEVRVAALVLDDGCGTTTVHRVDALQQRTEALEGIGATSSWSQAAASFTRATPLAPGADEGALIRRLVSDEWSNGLVAPVRTDGPTAGFLVVHDRLGMRGFVDSELAVLDVLASEVSNALHKAELLERILHERRQLGEIVTQTSDGIATLAVGGEVLTWNRGFEQLTGFDQDELVAEGGIAVLGARDGTGRPVPLGAWAEGVGLPAEIEVSTRTGSHRWLSCSYSPVSDPAGSARHLILIARDVTETRELQQAQDELRHSEARLRVLRESEERVQVLLRNASDVVVVVDERGLVSYSSHGSSFPGRLPAPSTGEPWLDLVEPDDRPDVRAALAAASADPGQPVRIEHRLADADGSRRWVETVVTDLCGVPPVDGVVLNTKDVTDRRQADALLASETEILGLIAREEALDEILRRTLASLERQVPGIRAAVVLAQDGRYDVVGGTDVGALDRAALAALAASEQGVPAGPGHGTLGVASAWVLHPLVGSGGTALGFVALDHPHGGDALACPLLRLFTGLAVVAVERHRSRAQLTHRATHDVLTGLPNRSMFVDRLTTALARTGRSGTWACVLYCDVDGFKSVNDTFGHDVGDDLLVAFGRRLVASVRSGDTAARLGGDEFVVLCEDLRHPAEAASIAEHVRAALAAPFPIAGRDVVVPPSIGVAVAGGGGDPQELLERADAAMYRAKRKGGNQWELTELLAQMP